MNDEYYYVYILTDRHNTILYVGGSTRIGRSILEPKNEEDDDYIRRFKLQKLVYYEAINNKQSAEFRKKQLKRWRREWKINLIGVANPTFKDLYERFN